MLLYPGIGRVIASGEGYVYGLSEPFVPMGADIGDFLEHFEEYGAEEVDVVGIKHLISILLKEGRSS